MQKKWVLLAVAFFVLGISVPGAAQEGGAGDFNFRDGPFTADIEGIADVRVPAFYVFADAKNTKKIMKASGNLVTGIEVGLVAPEDLSWFVVFEFSEVGYVKDDEKDKLDPDAMFDQMLEDNQAANEERKREGIPALNLIDWEMAPKYNEYTNNLEWAIRLRDEEGTNHVNHNVRVLGRKGVMIVTLVVEDVDLYAKLPDFYKVMGDFAFTKGQKYAEYRSGDKIAKYGLSALVVGGATVLAAKSGLFKYIWKILVLLGAGIAGFFKKLFGKKEK